MFGALGDTSLGVELTWLLKKLGLQLLQLCTVQAVQELMWVT